MARPKWSRDQGRTEGTGRPTSQEIHDLTPPGRNRYADFLRFTSLLVVVVGHWLIAVVVIREGRLEMGRLLTSVEATVWLTWLFQVMPVFFLVGGYANAASLAKDPPPVEWVRARARRLLRPIVPLFVVWLALTGILASTGLPERLVARTTSAGVVPVWFLAAYLAIVTLAPHLHRLHQAHGWRVIVAFVALATAVDVLLRFSAYDIGLFAHINYLFVWGAIHQVGFFWHDGRLPSGLRALPVALAGYGALALLTGLADYPLSMVGGTERPTNTTPPSVAILALAAGQLGLVLALQHRASRWLERPRPWAIVVRGGSVSMTVFLWHMTALVIVAALLVPTGLWPNLEPTEPAWWSLRPLWLAVLSVVLAGLVLVFGRFERPPPAGPPPRRAAGLRTVFGAVLTFASLGMIIHGGIYDGRYPFGIPWIEVGVLALGLASLGVFGRRPV